MFTERLRKFHFWCQKVLPLVYDNSLSYYEVLCKLTKIVNELIEIMILMGEKMDEWQARLDYFEETFAGFEERFAYFEEKFSWFEEKFNEYIDRFNHFEERFAYFESKFAEMLQIVEELQNLVNALNDRVDGLEDRVGDIEDDIVNINNAIQNLNNSLTNLTNRVTNIETVITTITGDVTNIENTINTINTRITNLENDNTSIKSRLTTVENSLASMQTSITNIQSSLTALTNRVTSLETNLTALTNRVNTIDNFTKLLPITSVNASDIFGDVTYEYFDAVVNLKTDFSGQAHIQKVGNTYKKYVRIPISIVMERETLFTVRQPDQVPTLKIAVKPPYKVVNYLQQSAPIINVIPENIIQDEIEWTNVDTVLKYIELSKAYGITTADNQIIYKAQYMFVDGEIRQAPIRTRIMVNDIVVEDTSFSY